MRADQHRRLQYLFITLSGAIYIYLSYFAQLHNSVPLIFSFAVLFFFLLVYISKDYYKMEAIDSRKPALPATIAVFGSKSF